MYSDRVNFVSSNITTVYNVLSMSINCYFARATRRKRNEPFVSLIEKQSILQLSKYSDFNPLKNLTSSVGNKLLILLKNIDGEQNSTHLNKTNTAWLSFKIFINLFLISFECRMH